MALTMNVNYVKSKPLRIFFLSIVFAICMITIRIVFNDSFGGAKNTYIIFFPLVMITALLGGWVAGITTLIVFIIGTAWFLLPPVDSIIIENKHDMFGLLIFTIGGFLMTFIGESFLRTKYKYQEQTHLLSKTSRKLRESKDQLQTILENVADGIVVRDNKGKPVYANYTAHELLGLPMKKSKRNLDLSKLDKQFTIIDATGKKIRSRQLPVNKILNGQQQTENTLCFRNKKTKKEKWFMTRARGIYDEVGNVQFVVIVFIDITTQQLLERQKDDFIGIASHELKTPVTSLKVYVQALERRFKQEGNERAIYYLQRMDNQISRLTMLIGDLLDVTNIESGKLPLHIEKFEIQDLIYEIAAEIQVTASKHKIILELDDHATIYADRNRIGQVITNLLTNAIKYSPEADKVVIKTQVDSKGLLVRVTDFGIGIPKKNQEKVFERFYREREEKGNAIPGVGLGLYISSEIIKRHHGKIWVESKPKKGTTFCFSLPLAR